MSGSSMSTLGEVVRATGGVLQTGPFGSQLHAEDYTTDGTPLIMPTNIGDNEIREGGISRIGTHDALRLRKHALREGDIVLGRRGDIGRRALVRKAQQGWICGSGCLAVRFGKRRGGLNPSYISEYIGSLPAQNWLQDNAVGGTMANLNTDIVGALPVWIPSLEHQERAAAALGQARSLISTLEALITKKEAIKQGMMQHLLTGKIRLPGFSRAWRRGTLGDVLTVRHGKNQRPVESPSGSYPILASGGRIGWASTPLYSKPSVLIGRKGTIDRPQYMESPFWTVDTLFYTEIAPTADPRFLYYVFLTVDWRSLNEASGVPSLSASRIETVEVVLPELDEQQAIREALDTIDTKIRILGTRLHKARAIKQAMMQELLTGRTRLPVEENVS